MEEKTEFEIGEVEGFTGDKDLKYSRSALIMRQTIKVQDDLSREMKPSFLIIKRDKYGNETKTFTDDARKRAISSVKTLLDTQECDFDEKIIQELKDFEEELLTLRQTYVDMEEESWNSLSEMARHNLSLKNLGFFKGCFHRDKPYGERFLDAKLEMYRKIFQSLLRLTKRLDYYKSETKEV